MYGLLEKMIDMARAGDYFSGVLITVFALIINTNKINKYLKEREKTKLFKLSEAIKCEHISGLSKLHLEEELATEHFRIVTGIRLEKEFREAVIKAHRDTEGEVSFTHFKRALPHIIYNKPILLIKVSIFEWIGYIINFSCGAFLAFLGVLILQGNHVNKEGALELIKRIGVGNFFIVIALFMIYSTSPLLSALKVKKSLKADALLSHRF